MTVSRTVEITYTAGEHFDVEAFEDYLRWGVENYRQDYAQVLNWSMMAGSAMPPKEPLVEPPPRVASDVQPPEGWYVLWCPGCLFSASWTWADAATYDPDDEWPSVADEACRHDCPARVGDDG